MRIILYNPMTASYIGRWAAILTSFTSAQIIACPGTRQQHHILQHSTSCVFPEQLKTFTVFHWPHGVPPHSNDATGVSIALRQDFASKKSVQVFSPPKELQGRAGVSNRTRILKRTSMIDEEF